MEMDFLDLHYSMDLIKAVAGVIKNSKLAVLILPGIGTAKDLKMARENGAEAGNARAEVLVAVLKKAGYDTNSDLYKTIDAAESVFKKIVSNSTKSDDSTLMLGYAGFFFI